MHSKNHISFLVKRKQIVDQCSLQRAKNVRIVEVAKWSHRTGQEWPFMGQNGELPDISQVCQLNTLGQNFEFLTESPASFALFS